MNPGEDRARDDVGRAYELGVPVLSQIVAEALDSLCVVDPQGEVIYGNVAACRVLACSPAELHDRHYDQFVAATSGLRTSVDSGSGREGSTAPAITTLLRPDGVEREVAYTPLLVSVANEPHGGAFFTDLTDARTTSRTAVALTQTAAQLVGSSPADVVLGIARHAVQGTRAVACRIVAVNDTDRLDFDLFHRPDLADDPEGVRSGRGTRAGRAAGGGAGLIAAMTGGLVEAGQLPGEPVVLDDCRSRWASRPDMTELAASMNGVDWQTGVWLPLSWQGRVFGLLGMHLPPTSPSPSQAELAYCSALADQAALAVVNARLAGRARETATLAERERLARDLHDSVSQALFSMTMHARTAEVLLARAGLSDQRSVSASVRALSQLAHDALQRMRALIVDLRPPAAG